MTQAIPLDSAWIAANPPPVHAGGTTKNSRGRVLVVGGSCRVPGAPLLTGEAALRVGAGKIQVACAAESAMAIGLAMPESAVLALDTAVGQIAGDGGAPLGEGLAACDAAVVGPGMDDPPAAERLARRVLADAGDDASVVIDAGAIGGLRQCRGMTARLGGRVVVTPHHGEMAVLTGRDAEAIGADPAPVALAAAREFGVVVALKGQDTWIATPDGLLLHYRGGGIGLATAGSGDVLAGAVVGLLSRGAAPLVAVAWGVWLHGHSGRRLAARRGPIGFLAREIAGEFPALLPQ